MAITFPTTLDSLTNPLSTDTMVAVSHSSQHSNENDAIEALEAKVGVDNSAVTTSLDYKLKSTSSVSPGHKHNATDIADGSVSNTEFQYLGGVSSDIQTQLDAKATDSFKTISVSGQSDVVADSKTDTLTLVAGTNVTITTNAGTDTITINSTASGTGDVVGPASATDNAIARFDSTTGKLIQDSAVTIADTTGDITGGKYNTVAISGSATPTLAVTGTSSISGANTGDNATNTQYSGLVSNATHTGDAEGATSLTVKRINGTALSSLATGVLKNTTTTGVPFISKVALTEPATASTLTIADNQTLTVNGSATITNGTHSGTNTGDQTITLTGAVTGTGTGSFATTIATPGTLTVSSTNSTATAHTHAVTSSSAPGVASSILATDASGHIGSTGTRIAKIWATDITATNAIAGSVTGNAATVTTNANLTGAVTSTGNATSLGSFTTSQLNTALSDNDIATGGGTATGTNTGNQTIANTSDATSHTVTLSASGGSVQLIEGTGVTLTTGGSGSAGTVTIATSGGTGDVVGPGTATNNVLSRFDGTTGKLIQVTGITASDTNDLSGIANLDMVGQLTVDGSFTNTMLINGGISFVGASHRRINDGSDNELIKFPTTSVASAVNEFTITNAATGTGPTISATGGDTNIDFNVVTKGSGVFKVNGSTVGAVTSIVGITGTFAQFNTAVTDADFARTDAANTFTGVQTMTSPAIVTSLDTATTSFTALAGATTLLTLGGTGASASTFMPSTLDATSSITGAIRTSGGISAAKAANFGTTVTVGTNIELGHASDTTLSRVSAGVVAVEGVTIPTISSTNTITGKRNQPRIVSATSYTTDTGTSLDFSTCDVFIVTAQAGALLFNNPSGTPVHGEKIIIRVKDNGTARALTYGSQYRAVGVTLPTTTVISKTLYIGGIWNTTDTKLDVVAVANEA